MNSNAPVAHLPCPCCQGRRYFVIPNWQTDNVRSADAVEPMTIAALRVGSGMFATRERVSVPLLLRVCADCGAAQAFADPASLRALTQMQPLAAVFVDGSASQGRQR
ncbi:MAG: hypothetical protein IPJ34_05265 [Myxococcales bacterium]|nr:hypothetical protein [Myxococcales bacterium]